MRMQNGDLKHVFGTLQRRDGPRIFVQCTCPYCKEINETIIHVRVAGRPIHYVICTKCKKQFRLK